MPVFFYLNQTNEDLLRVSRRESVTRRDQNRP